MSKDAGKHYRFVYRVKVTKKDAKRGYIDVKLDPFRIALIYGMVSFALNTILKKCLCAGNRGHKSYRQDLDDIISAAQRELEIIGEDTK